MTYYVSSQPAAEPLSLTEAKAHLRVTSTSEDTLITAYVAAARTSAEKYLWRSLITQTITVELECLPSGNDPLLLPGGNVQSITSLKYTDSDGVLTTITDAQEQLNAEPAELTPAYTTAWPSARRIPASIQVVYVAGYGDAGSDVPEAIRHAMRLMIGDFYLNRENQPTVPVGSAVQSKAAENLMQPFSVRDQRLLEVV